MRVRRQSGSWRYSSDFLGIDVDYRPKWTAMHRLQKHGSAEQIRRLPTGKVRNLKRGDGLKGKMRVDQAAPLK
jgi:hypothetical protein